MLKIRKSILFAAAAAGAGGGGGGGAFLTAITIQAANASREPRVLFNLILMQYKQSAIKKFFFFFFLWNKLLAIKRNYFTCLSV